MDSAKVPEGNLSSSAPGSKPGAAAKSEAATWAPSALPQARPLEGRSFLVCLVERLSYHVARATVVLSLLLAAGMIFCLLLQVFFRYLLDSPLSWTDEAAIFCFAWTMLLLASVCVREHVHVRFSFLADLLPPRLGGLLDRAIILLIAAFGIVLVTAGQELVDLVWGNLSPAVHYPLQALYLALPVQGALIVLHAAANFLTGQPERR